MAHLQYMPGDPRLVDQLVYELKSKGIFDQFRKDCIADVDTRPAYQNLRQRVESSVAAFLSRQIWKPDLNKNQLREKLRKHLLDGNYLEQGVERIVDQVVNPKVASVFIPQVEDLVYNYLGIPRKKSTANAEATEGKSSEDLLPTDLEAVSPGSVKSNGEKNDAMDVSNSKEETKMDIEEKPNAEIKEDSIIDVVDNSNTADDSKMSVIEVNQDSQSSIDKNTTTIPLPAEEIKLENIPAPENSPPNIKDKKIDLEKIDLPKEPNLSTDIPLPDEIPKMERNSYFQPMSLASEDDSSSDSSLQRNMSPLTPIRNYNNENSCDAQQGFDNDSDSKSEVKKEPTTFRFAIENKSPDKSPETSKVEKKEPEQDLSHQFTNQVNINTFNTPMYEDSSNSNMLQIDYESDVNSKLADIKPPETEQNSVDSKKEKKSEERKISSHKSSHRSRDSHRQSSSSKDKRSESKHSSSRDSHRHDKKSSKDDKTKSTSNKDKTSEKGDKNNEKTEKPSEKTEKKDSKEKDRDSSKHRSSSHKSSRDKDSKHRSSSSCKHSSSKHDDRKSSSTSKDKSSDKSKDSKDKSRDKSSSHRSDKDKDRKSSSKSKSDEKENKEKKEKKETDDHYSLSGRGNPNRRSTDRDSNDGSTSSKGSHNLSTTKSSTSKKETKSSSKSENTASDNSSSPSDKDVNAKEHKVNNTSQKVVRVDTHLEVPIQSPPRLPFVPDVTLKKPRFAANLAEAKKMMKMRKFLEEEQKRMNQEAALLLEFQANVRPSFSQVYSSIPGPELEFACVPNTVETSRNETVTIENASMDRKPESKREQLTEVSNIQQNITEVTVDDQKDAIAETLIAMHLEHNVQNKETEVPSIEQSHHDIIQTLTDDDDDVKSEIDRENYELITDGIVKVDNEESNMETEEYLEVTVIVAEPEHNDENKAISGDIDEYNHFIPEETELHYFAEPEKYVAELEKDRFSRFLKSYTDKIPSKIYLINCDSYEESLIKDVSNKFGNFEIVNYHKNGHLKMPAKNKNVIKNVNLNTEIIIPPKLNENTFTNEIDIEMAPGIFSPAKSESSFELHSDYDAKLEEMVNKTSRQQIMEIILGNVDESPSKMPSIEYCMESSIESAGNNLKRKYNDVDTNVNNNITVLTSNKIRKLSDSDQISSTTEETEETANDVSFQNNKKSKYLGKARRVGLPKPKRTLPNPNSPSSDQSVENYSTDLRESPKKVKPPRNKVQRYDTSDLYKPKLHFLSRRNFTLNE